MDRFLTTGCTASPSSGHETTIANRDNNVVLTSARMSHPLYRPDIDGMRAIAVLSVICFHAFPDLMPGGFIGVDIFFVISGFLISTIIFQNLENNTFSYKEFYVRRINRILPALLIVLTSSLAFGYLTLFAFEYKALAKHVVAGAGFASNFVLWKEAGYFDKAAELKPLLHLWSLGIEEQFYIVCPLFLALLWKRKKLVIFALILICALSFSWNVFSVRSNPIGTFYSPQTRIWELLCGGILAWLVLFRPSSIKRLFKSANDGQISATGPLGAARLAELLPEILSALGVVLLTVGFWSINKDLPFPGLLAAIPVMAAVCLILAGPRAWINRWILANPVLVWLGLISFPLYLWHWPLLSFLSILSGDTATTAQRLIAVLAAVLLAWLTFATVEARVRHGARKQRSALALLALMLVVGVSGAGIMATDGYTLFNEPFRKITEAEGDWSHPKGLTRRPDDLYTTSDRAPTVLFFGDSLLEQYSPRVVDLYKKGLIKEAGFVTRGGCAPIPNAYRSELYIEKCEGHFINFEKALKNNPIDTILIGGSFAAYFRNKAAFYIVDDHKEYLTDPKKVEHSMRMFYDFILQLKGNYNVIVVANTPNSRKFEPSSIITQGTFRIIPLEPKKFNNKVPYNFELEDKMDADIKALGIPFLKPSTIICPNQICLPLTEDGKPKFKDNSHLRPFFVIEYMDIFDRFLLK